MSFDILVVCTGNICRSPMAERLIRAGLRARLGHTADRFEVSSAGTWGFVGSPMEPSAEQVCRELGADPAGFHGRELTGPMVAHADLVLAMARQHRAAVVTLHPRAAGRSFTLPEFARLAAAVDPATLPADDAVERARALVRAVAGKRGLVPLVEAVDDDVADPYGAPLEAFRTVGATIAAALAHPLDLLGGSALPPYSEGAADRPRRREPRGAQP